MVKRGNTKGKKSASKQKLWDSVRDKVKAVTANLATLNDSVIPTVPNQTKNDKTQVHD